MKAVCESKHNKIQGVEHVRRTLRSMVDNLTIEKKENKTIITEKDYGRTQ